MQSFVYIRTPQKEITIQSISKNGRRLVAIKCNSRNGSRIIGMSIPKSA